MVVVLIHRYKFHQPSSRPSSSDSGDRSISVRLTEVPCRPRKAPSGKGKHKSPDETSAVDKDVRRMAMEANALRRSWLTQSETDLTRNLIIPKSAYEYPAHFTVMHYFKFSQFIVSKRRFEPSASSYVVEVAIIEYPSIFDKRSSRSKCWNAASIKCYESKGKRREQKNATGRETNAAERNKKNAASRNE